MRPFQSLAKATKAASEKAVKKLADGFKSKANLQIAITKSGGRFFYKHYNNKQLNIEFVQNSFTKTKITQNNLISFVYSPKFKDNPDVLPIYDTLPLILIFGIEKRLFRGINFHFLNPSARFLFLQRLYEVDSLRTLTEKSKKKFTYDIIKSAANDRWIKQTVKSYLFTHVKSEFINFSLEDSEELVLLPTPKTIVKNK